MRKLQRRMYAQFVNTPTNTVIARPVPKRVAIRYTKTVFVRNVKWNVSTKTAIRTAFATTVQKLANILSTAVGVAFVNTGVPIRTPTGTIPVPFVCIFVTTTITRTGFVINVNTYARTIIQRATRPV